MVNETDLAPLSAAARWFPQRNGRPVSVKAIVRRIRKGHRGVRLRATLDGGQWFTTRQWVDEFQAAVTEAAVPAISSPSASSRAHSAAMARLERRYGRGGTKRQASEGLHLR
jgi:hypothetical protein